jgi:filamentous hemagglutinin
MNGSKALKVLINYKTVDDDNEKKTAFGAMSNMQTTGGLIAANMSAGNANLTQWKAANCAALTELACSEKFQQAAKNGEMIGKNRVLDGPIPFIIGSFNSKQPHEYSHDGTACKSGDQSCSEKAYSQLLKIPGPGADGINQVKNGTVSELYMLTQKFGYVTHLVDPSTQTVVNITVPGQHPLDPGFVVRTVNKQSDGSTTINSYGAGTGNSPIGNSNSWLAPVVWGGNVNFGISPAIVTPKIIIDKSKLGSCSVPPYICN